MRPPLITGENDAAKEGSTLSTIGFNEAPADHGGKQNHGQEMQVPSPRFNEAPADHGGKHGSVGAAKRVLKNGFNEAPADHGGKRRNASAQA